MDFGMMINVHLSIHRNISSKTSFLSSSCYGYHGQVHHERSLLAHCIRSVSIPEAKGPE
jgi:hypothetical protein